jgi:hypothetical protein
MAAAKKPKAKAKKPSKPSATSDAAKTMAAMKKKQAENPDSCPFC